MTATDTPTMSTSRFAPLLPKPPQLSRFQKFLSYYQPYRRLLALDLLCAFVISAITLLLPISANHITKNILATPATDMLNQILLTGVLMLVLVGIHTACNLFVDYRGHMMGAMMERDMRRELFDHYQKLSFGFYDEHKTGQLMTLITNDLFWLAELYHHGPEDLAIALLKGGGVLVILFAIDVPLAVCLFLFLPIMAGYAFYFNRRMNRALRISRDRIGDINAQVEDTLAGIRVVKSFTNEALEAQKFAIENQRFLQSRSDGYRSEAYSWAGIVAFTQLLTLVVLILGGIQIANGALALADLLTFLLCVGILVEPIQRAVNFARLYQEGVTGFNRFMDLLEVQPEPQDAPNATDLTAVQGHITFENVSFRYREEYDFVLKNLSVTIQAGEYVALVGASGVGKTTLCSLIPRFYDVDAGRILIDEQAIQAVRLRSLRQQIGIVQQDVYLFAGTVLENIQYGSLEASRAAIIAATQKAYAHEFIMALPQGYDTDIGQRGIKLSGGQKQRLSIARVFLKNPPILIFDEATSSLDNESERAVQDSLEQLRHHRTMLVIAHRLSTVRNAQRILVLGDNGIEEQGTHDDLIARDGIYAHLYAMQLRL